MIPLEGNHRPSRAVRKSAAKWNLSYLPNQKLLWRKDFCPSLFVGRKTLISNVYHYLLLSTPTSSPTLLLLSTTSSKLNSR
ncbi:hypothetical protein [Saccharolobus islandicus]|uniref:hypothetical protein n=1 Tax=Saccharolobus islandicus TaxID=43080 RepID=UPI0011D1B4AD|nr:hypothetical protein [Sulfolobus islandicus]